MGSLGAMVHQTIRVPVTPAYPREYSDDKEILTIKINCITRKSHFKYEGAETDRAKVLYDNNEIEGPFNSFDMIDYPNAEIAIATDFGGLGNRVNQLSPKNREVVQMLGDNRDMFVQYYKYMRKQ